MRKIKNKENTTVGHSALLNTLQTPYNHSSKVKGHPCTFNSVRSSWKAVEIVFTSELDLKAFVLGSKYITVLNFIKISQNCATCRFNTR